MHISPEFCQIFAEQSMGLFPLLDLLLSVFVGDELAEEVEEGLVAIFPRVGQISGIFLSFFQDCALVFKVLMHGFVLFGCVDSFDGCEGAGESVEDEHIFDVDHPREPLMMPHSLSFQPVKYLLVPFLGFLIKVCCGFLLGLDFLLVVLQVLPDGGEGLSPA